MVICAPAAPMIPPVAVQAFSQTQPSHTNFSTPTSLFAGAAAAAAPPSPLRSSEVELKPHIGLGAYTPGSSSTVRASVRGPFSTSRAELSSNAYPYSHLRYRGESVAWRTDQADRPGPA